MMALNSRFEDAKRLVQASPGDIGARSALWQIFAARGEFSRARTQLDAMVSINSSWALEAASCTALLKAEELRLKVFSGTAQPTCLGEPPAWFAKIVSALPLLQRESAGTKATAVALLREAQQDSDGLGGLVNGRTFSWLCDGDARLGPCMEMIVQGNYLWAPWIRVSKITSRAPTEIRDRLWLHAMVEFGDDGAFEAFLPARYPHPQNDAEHLGEVTTWQPIDDEAYIGLGQKTLLTDGGEVGLLDVRELRFHPAPELPSATP